jgi:hypothetical protein
MKIKLIVGAIALAMSFGFVACSDDSSDNPVEVVKTQPKNEVEPGCNFKKEDNVWKYSATTWNFIEIYTWVDETSVRYEEYMNSYHMEELDTTFTDVNRDEKFEEVMDDCLGYWPED